MKARKKAAAAKENPMTRALRFPGFVLPPVLLGDGSVAGSLPTEVGADVKVGIAVGAGVNVGPVVDADGFTVGLSSKTGGLDAGDIKEGNDEGGFEDLVVGEIDGSLVDGALVGRSVASSLVGHCGGSSLPLHV